jgi:hypothetical protein
MLPFQSFGAILLGSLKSVSNFAPTCLLLLAAGLAGCASADSHAYRQPNTGNPVADCELMVQNGPRKDQVLWEYRGAAHAMRRNQFAEAKRFLDDALARISNIYGRDKDAKKARSVFHEESKKTFIGEPYERVMANYYRGILYWMDGEPDNARACFRNAQFMDSDTEDKTYAGDYLLMDYLDGLATVKLNGDGSDAFKQAQKHAKAKLPELDPKANVLFFIEFGPGPQKFATGEYGQELRIRTFPSPVFYTSIKADGREVARSGPYDDLNFQATTRGGRVMDHVLANKAVYKTTTDTVGNVAVVAGAVMASNRGTREAGFATLGAGLVAKIFASAMTAAADIRAWDNLPQYLAFAAVPLPPGHHQVTVEFQNQAQQVLGTFTKQITVNVQPLPRDTVVFVSDQSITPQTQ